MLQACCVARHDDDALPCFPCAERRYACSCLASHSGGRSRRAGLQHQQDQRYGSVRCGGGRRRRPAAVASSLPAPPDVAAPPEDAMRTPSGLASKVLVQGTGTDHPTSNDSVKVNYTGWTTDGKMFDSTVAPPQPGRKAQPGRPHWNRERQRTASVRTTYRLGPCRATKGGDETFRSSRNLSRPSTSHMNATRMVPECGTGGRQQLTPARRLRDRGACS